MGSSSALLEITSFLGCDVATDEGTAALASGEEGDVISFRITPSAGTCFSFSNSRISPSGVKVVPRPFFAIVSKGLGVGGAEANEATRLEEKSAFSLSSA